MDESKALQFGLGHKSLIRFSWLAVLWSLLLCLGLFSTPATAAVPTVSGISPTSGPAAGGTSVVIIGTNFTGAIAVSFGATPAPGFTVNSATQIIATAPTGAQGTINITVTTTEGTSATGASTLYTFVEAPGAPTIGTATAGNAQASVSFTAPASDGGAAISGYTVTSSPGGITGTGASSPITVTSLTNGGAYTFTVTATNSAGTGPASAASISVTPKASQTITFNNPGTQTFGTTPTLSAIATSGLSPAFSSSTSGVCTITSGGALTFVTAGSCTINADQAGNGSYLSAPQVSQTFTVTPVVPSAPTIGTATAGNTQASVTFTAPVSNGGATIFNYTVTSSPGGITGTGASSPIAVTSLTNGTAYTFTVTATNSAGTGAASAASTSVTPRASQIITFSNPGAQALGTTPTLSASSTSGLTVTFTSGTTGVCTITSGGALSFVTAGSCTINADQTGDGSFLAATQASETFTVTPVVPGAPTIGTASAGDTQASVSFTAPTSSGGAAISGYTVTSNPGGLTGSGTASPINVTGLTNGTAYTFTIRASNSVGTGSASAASNSVIPKAPQTITFSNPGAQNFGTIPTLSASATSGLTLTFTSSTTGVCTITSNGVLTFVTAGSCTINADQAGNGSYLAAPQASQTFTVNPVVPLYAPASLVPAGVSPGEQFYLILTTNGVSAATSTSMSNYDNFVNADAQSGPPLPGVSSLTWKTLGATSTVDQCKPFADLTKPVYTVTKALVKSTAAGMFSGGGTSLNSNVGVTPSGGSPIAGMAWTGCNNTGSPVSGHQLGTANPGTGITSQNNSLWIGFGNYSALSGVVEVSQPLYAVSPLLTAPIAPNAPTIGTATAGNTQASVTFAAPASNGGADISGYTATSSPGSLTGTGASSPITVTGLTNGVAYTFTVTATNSAGTGAASAASNSVTPTAPQTITFINPGAQNFGTTPALTASASSGLPLTFTTSTAGVCTITSGGVLTFVTTGSCTINADQAGNGSYLAAPQVGQTFSVNPVVPGAPTIGTATAGNTQASVTFTPPASNGGAAISGYTVTSNPGGLTGSGTASPINVTGLTNGTAYTFTVRASNSVGTGSASAASNSVIPKASQAITFSNPGAQNYGTTPTLTATSSSSLAVTFTSSTTGICTITSGGALTFVATGTCTINADQAGNSSYLAAPQISQSFTINAVVPGSPTIGTATAGNTQATITFTAPASNGGTSISGYTVTSNPGGLTGSGTASPINVTGLTNGTAYTFTVRASNSVGTGSASAASNSVTPAASLATSYTGTTAGGSVTAAITGGSCAGFQDGSAQYNMPGTAPAGQRFPYGAFSFTVLSCGPGGSVTITQTYPNSIAPNAKYHKLINGNWIDWTANVTIAGNTVMLTLTDGQSGDTNPTAGEISDPGGITVADDSGMAPIPTLSEWMLMVLAGLMAFVAIRRASAVAKAHMSSQV